MLKDRVVGREACMVGMLVLDKFKLLLLIPGGLTARFPGKTVPRAPGC